MPIGATKTDRDGWVDKEGYIMHIHYKENALNHLIEILLDTKKYKFRGV